MSPLPAHVEQFVPCEDAERVDGGLWRLHGVGIDEVSVSTLPAPMPIKVYVRAVLGHADELDVRRTELVLTVPGRDDQVLEGSILTTAQTPDDDLPGVYQDLLEATFTAEQSGLHVLKFAVDGEIMAMSSFVVRAGGV